MCEYMAFPKMHVLVKFIYHTERQFGMAVLAFYCFVCDGENVCILLTRGTLRDMF